MKYDSNALPGRPPATMALLQGAVMATKEKSSTGLAALVEKALQQKKQAAATQKPAGSSLSNLAGRKQMGRPAGRKR
ncbi:hypothetical protein [Achromobacter marplatensis]|jgi:hypothetical protein|uniref:hypothetical protein n=1 Tax=Achromobacter marplatensis TaxID=470868 RepID=UPI0011783792|nr:hypothetical protein [Achromobacter marplatensis]